MQVHPEIAALRTDPARQRRDLAAINKQLANWLALDQVSQLADDLASYAEGASLSSLDALAQCFARPETAETLVDGLIGQFAPHLRENQLAEMPFNHSSNPGFARLQLMRSGTASLSLCCYNPVRGSGLPEAARFVDCEVHEIVLAGSARILRSRIDEHRGPRPRIRSCQLNWSKGDTGQLEGVRESREITDVAQTLVLLQLSRTPPAPQPTREYRLADGSLVLQSSGDKKASEQVMALGVLGALGSRDTIEPMVVFALDGRRDRDARWEAVRQVLTMDAARGFAALCLLSEASGDSLSAPARELRDHLAEQYPVLARSRLETV